MGGLAAAIDLARAGYAVTVIEQADCAGGKLREVMVEGRAIDAGPTVVTMPWVFEDLFAAAGAQLHDHLRLSRLETLARHAWPGGATLDLHADIGRSTEAIGAFAGLRAAAEFREFCTQATALLTALQARFMTVARPSPFALARSLRPAELASMWQTPPWQTLWSALSRRFADVRLRQLFARYATYVGSSPLQAPATLMLIAQVEQNGVWQAEGGMRSIAKALEQLGRRLGVRYRYQRMVTSLEIERGRIRAASLADGERLEADIVIFNGDVNALASAALGEQVRHCAKPITPPQRSLSAVTWCQLASVSHFDLAHHNVFFGPNYEDEFRRIFEQRNITDKPTVYLCAQDRLNGSPSVTPERMLLLINAPAEGDRSEIDDRLLEQLEQRMRAVLGECGAELSTSASVATCPQDFARLFPHTSGALYGRANHGAFASFARPDARTKIAGLYLAGGSVHPGPGIPMATLSGRIAAASAIADFLRG
jgi:1-hydroxycarotenoid 3,4-desaturase